MFGDVLRKNIDRLQKATKKDFWIILRDIAVEDIKAIKPEKVDSDNAVPIYYEILKINKEKIPIYFQERLASNDQERFRVINRNIWTSNAFHSDGLANQSGISAIKRINENKKGERIIYKGE